ncbi:hypothetical protein [Argonema antarcticum]|uniref:hypothetical protein n=1 Tax=Argonema antarcticum TaxID=2942763 RepID=UPI0020115EE1|nr:hypothetical protein [Argonema antarcticum]MCL1469296.1 hypothetical protein [Argonema antarcticum A004/B2]
MLPQRPSISQIEPPLPAKRTLPTMYDLPSENREESGLADEFHGLQSQLLGRTLRLTDYRPASLSAAICGVGAILDKINFFGQYCPYTVMC